MLGAVERERRRLVIGTARALVAPSGSCPAWIWAVSNFQVSGMAETVSSKGDTTTRISILSPRNCRQWLNC